MLETIFAASLALSVNLGDYQPITQADVSIQPSTVAGKVLEPEYLAGKPYESKYRREVDSSHEEHNHQHQNHSENRGGRIHRDSDRYRQDREYEYRRDRQDRVYRDDDDRHQEVEYRRRDRSYPQGSYGNYPSDSRDRRYRY